MQHIFQMLYAHYKRFVQELWSPDFDMSQLRGVVAEQTSRSGSKSRADTQKHFPIPNCFSYCCFQVIIPLNFRASVSQSEFEFLDFLAIHGRSQLLATIWENRFPFRLQFLATFFLKLNVTFLSLRIELSIGNRNASSLIPRCDYHSSLYCYGVLCVLLCWWRAKSSWRMSIRLTRKRNWKVKKQI